MPPEVSAKRWNKKERGEAMSRFYGDLEGNRGVATRQGTANSGIVGHIRGWSVGARVRCFVNEHGQDTVQVWTTGGSHQPGGDILLAEFDAETAGLCRSCTSYWLIEQRLQCRHGQKPYTCFKYQSLREATEPSIEQAIKSKRRG